MNFQFGGVILVLAALAARLHVVTAPTDVAGCSEYVYDFPAVAVESVHVGVVTVHTVATVPVDDVRVTEYVTCLFEDRATDDQVRAMESSVIVGVITGATSGEKVAPENGYDTPTRVADDCALVEKTSSEAEENIAVAITTPATVRRNVLPQIICYPQVTVEH